MLRTELIERVASWELIVCVGPHGTNWFGKTFRCCNNIKVSITPHQTEMESANCCFKSYQDRVPNELAMHLERYWKVAKTVKPDCPKDWRIIEEAFESS